MVELELQSQELQLRNLSTHPISGELGTDIRWTFLLISRICEYAWSHGKSNWGHKSKEGTNGKRRFSQAGKCDGRSRGHNDDNNLSPFKPLNVWQFRKLKETAPGSVSPLQVHASYKCISGSSDLPFTKHVALQSLFRPPMSWLIFL